MVAHVTEYPGSFRLTSCDVGGRAERGRSSISRTEPSRRHLRLVVDNDRPIGQRNDVTQSARPIGSQGGDLLHAALQKLGLVGGLTTAAAVVAVVIVALLVGVRLSQGGPPAEFVVNGGEQVAESTAAPGDLVVVAGPGDSLWSLAGEYAAGQDRREAVAAMVEANGGAAIVVGQAIVIPGQLLA